MAKELVTFQRGLQTAAEAVVLDRKEAVQPHGCGWASNVSREGGPLGDVI
jgi:hypothetical protein